MFTLLKIDKGKVGQDRSDLVSQLFDVDHSTDDDDKGDIKDNEVTTLLDSIEEKVNLNYTEQDYLQHVDNKKLNNPGEQHQTPGALKREESLSHDKNSSSLYRVGNIY